MAQPADIPLRLLGFARHRLGNHVRAGLAGSASAILFVSRIAGAACGFVTQILLAKMFLPDDLGLFFHALSVATIAAVFAALGYPGLAGRVASRNRSGPWAFDRFVKTALVETFAVSTVFALLLVAAYVFAGTNAAPLLLIASIPFLAIGPMLAAALNMQRRNLQAFLPDIVARPVIFLTFTATLYWFAPTTGLAAVAGFYLMLAMVIAAGQIGLLAQQLRRAPLVRDRRLRRAWRFSSLPLAVVTIVTTFNADVAIAASGLFLPSAELAIFAVSMKISYLVGFITQISQQLALPDLSDAWKRRDHASLSAAFRKAAVFPAVCTGISWVAIYLYGDRLLRLFGEEYVIGLPVLLLLVAGQMLRAIAGPVMQLAIVAGTVRPMVRIVVPATLLLFVALALLAPTFGVLAAAACISAYLAWPLLLAFQVRGLLRRS